MTKISTMQIEEILDDEDEIRIAKHESIEGAFVVSTRSNGDETMREIGTDIGTLVDELHNRL